MAIDAADFKGNEYKVIQSLENHSNEVFKIIELNNKSLVSYCYVLHYTIIRRKKTE